MRRGGEERRGEEKGHWRLVALSNS